MEKATSAGVKAEAILVDGGEVSAIVRAAQREHADLLVIGLPKHHGLGAFNSTAHEVADQTPCPLLEVN
jgi:nucleotide-binding universal stress UspA family protein